MTSSNKYIDQELSWLAFNERVLQEAADDSVPIIERVRFLGIYSNNLDEFFRVRFGEAKRMLMIHEGKPDAVIYTDLLHRIQAKALEMQEKFDQIYTDILWRLARRNIFLVNESQVAPEQERWLRKYFRDNIQASLVPIFIKQETDLTVCIKDDLTYLGIEIRQGAQSHYAVLEVPSDEMDRFVRLPKLKDGRRKSLILLDNVIRYCLTDLLGGLIGAAEYAAYAFKVTRDADFDVSDEIDESLVHRLSEGLKKRITAMPVRFVYDREMPEEMLHFLVTRLNIASYDGMIPGGRYHNFKDFMTFPALGPKYLLNKKLRALDCKAFDTHPNAFEAIRAQDILLYYPYHKFRYFSELVRQAACDPQTRRIKLSIYRVAKGSRLINSLIDATNNGKEVTVVVELQARFDEAANIEWAKKLDEAGVCVEFGIPRLKIHSKICLIEREEQGEIASYAYVGTGNFHEGTARIYTDFSLFTAHQEIVKEVGQVFDTISNMYKRYRYKHLIVSPHDIRGRLTRLIKMEMLAAQKNQRAEILIKMNNLTDEKIIQQLYAASASGVKIRIIIRGMCSLVAGVKGLSENIRVISIIDRFLEHSRVLIFHNAGNKQVFIGSADLMARNMDHRVEVICPIYDPRLKKQIQDILDIQWKDTTKARIIDSNMKNQYVTRGNRKKIRSQIEIHEYLKAVEESGN